VAIAIMPAIMPAEKSDFKSINILLFLQSLNLNSPSPRPLLPVGLS